MEYRSAPLFFIGARASGKSTIGKALADLLGWDFCDTDAFVQEKAGMSIAHMVEKHGWHTFRAKEAEALRSATKARTVIATGGGMILDASNRQFMRKHGFVCFLDAPVPVLVQRLRAAPQENARPPLTKGGLVDEVSAVRTRRLPLYKNTAHICINTSMPLPYILRTTCKALRKGAGSAL